MYNMQQFMSMLKQGYNPQQIVMNVLQNQMGGTPMGNNLIKLAQSGNTAEIEKIARNLASQQGIDFDKEFKAFRQQFGL